jgi:hypothetical protein
LCELENPARAKVLQSFFKPAGGKIRRAVCRSPVDVCRRKPREQLPIGLPHAYLREKPASPGRQGASGFVWKMFVIFTGRSRARALYSKARFAAARFF